MSNVLVVLSSARKGRVADKVFEYVKKDLEARDDINIIKADLKEINLPFFAHELAPASPDYVPTDPAVIAWGKLVSEADAIVWLTPEYNHTVNAIQKNAIDSLKAEWEGKPVVIIGYGWTGASLSLVTLNEVLPFLKADLKPNAAHLSFMKEINTDGTLIDEASVTTKIKTAIDEIA
jgi:NAD(P)H-dependent FMN reductase